MQSNSVAEFDSCEILRRIYRIKILRRDRVKFQNLARICGVKFCNRPYLKDHRFQTAP